jgi:hypothetical protein
MTNVKSILSRFFLGTGIVLASACTQTVGHFTPTPASNPDNTVLYVYRPAATTPGLMKPLKYDYPDVLIDGTSVGVLKYDEYLVTQLAPGAHTITITGLTAAASGWSPRDIKQAIPPGNNKEIFMRLKVEYDVNEMNLGQPGAKYIIQLAPVEPENAIYEIRNTTRASN